MKKRGILKTLIIISTMIVLVPITTFAYPMNNDWSTNQWVGWNHQTSGNIVRCVQVMMNSANFNAGDVDGYYGANTHNAIMSYQQAHTLSADGTVGTNTWNNMHNYLIYFGPGGGINPLNSQYSSTDNYKWIAPGSSSNTGFIKWINAGNWDVIDSSGNSYELY